MIVVSDLIGTLTTGSPTLGLVSWVRANQSALRANWYLAALTPSYALYKLGLTDIRKFGERSMVRALPLIHGATPEIIADMGEWSVEHELWPKRREEVLERLESHREAGQEVYIASSTFQPAVEVFAERIGARAIGSPIEIVAGVPSFTSEMIPGDRKAEAVFRRLGDLKIGAAYGDTWADIPILERADKPVAVYPDAKLEAVALERGWEILR